METTTQLSPPRFAHGETVQVPTHGSARLGRIVGHEPGCGLQPPVEGWAHHVELLGADDLRYRVVAVGEDDLLKLVED